MFDPSIKPIMDELKIVDGAPAGGIVVCASVTSPLFFADNVVGVCGSCGVAVQHRPSVPAGAALVCLPCFAVKVTETDKVIVTRATVIELGAWRRRN